MRLCETTTADVGTKIYIQGGEPDLATTYEWHVSVFDSAGMRSDTAIIECTTPNAEGEGSLIKLAVEHAVDAYDARYFRRVRVSLDS